MTVQELTSKAGKAGGKATQSRRTPAQRSAFAASGGKAGGVARAAVLSPEERKTIASNAAKARWAKEAPAAGKRRP